MAEEGIETIGAAAFQRGFDALNSYSKTCQLHNVTKIKACGTAAMRTASNGPDFVDEVLKSCNIQIDIIDGISEAKYISKGVQLALPKTPTARLIMDIGGGSVEFILIRHNELVWAKSFPIGVAVLKKEFHQSDPISKSELEVLFNFLDERLKPLKSILEKDLTIDLVGASGTFDVLQNMITQVESGKNYSQLSLDEFKPLADLLIEMELSKRNQFPNLPAERSELIVVALVLIQFVLQLHPFKNLYVSRYALKEGILSSLTKS